MNRNLTLLTLLVALAATAALAGADPRASTPAASAAAQGAAKPPTAAPGAAGAAAMSLVVSPAWLAAHLGDPDVVLLHVGDADAYRAKHIAGARLIALDDFSVSASGHDGLHLELPPAEELRRHLEALGISNSSRIVVYFGDDWISPATRVVLTLDIAGLGAQTALLDGGMPGWLRAGHAVTAAVTPARTGRLAPLALRPIVVDATTVVSSLGKPGVAVVDARDAEYYSGASAGGMPMHLHRAGHIAGALSLPYSSVFDDQQRLRPDDDLRARFAKAGVAPGDTVIGYCHIGQQATAMLFAARRLGHPILLYDGSFEDWSQHSAYPVEIGGKAAKPTAKPGAKR